MAKKRKRPVPHGEARERPTQPLPVGSVLGRTFVVWLWNLFPFALLAAVVFAPLIYYTVRLTQTAALTRAGRVLGDDWTLWAGAVMFGGPMLGLVASGPVSYGVVQHLRGEPARVGPCLVVGLKRLLPIVSVVVLLVAAVGLWSIPGSMLMGVLVDKPKDYGAVAVAGMFLLAGIPALLCLVRLSVSVPVATVEGRGGFGSFARSRALTRGNRWRVFAVFLPLFCLHWGGLTGISYVVALLDLGRSQWAVSVWTSLTFSIVVSSCLMAVASAIVYYDLRVAKDGVTVAEIAKIFD